MKPCFSALWDILNNPWREKLYTTKNVSHSVRLDCTQKLAGAVIGARWLFLCVLLFGVGGFICVFQVTFLKVPCKQKCYYCKVKSKTLFWGTDTKFHTNIKEKNSCMFSNQALGVKTDRQKNFWFQNFVSCCFLLVRCGASILKRYLFNLVVSPACFLIKLQKNCLKPLFVLPNSGVIQIGRLNRTLDCCCKAAQVFREVYVNETRILHNFDPLIRVGVLWTIPSRNVSCGYVCLAISSGFQIPPIRKSASAERNKGERQLCWRRQPRRCKIIASCSFSYCRLST